MGQKYGKKYKIEVKPSAFSDEWAVFVYGPDGGRIGGGRIVGSKQAAKEYGEDIATKHAQGGGAETYTFEPLRSDRDA